MKKKTWKGKIIASCKEAGTYRECFNDMITVLAETLETRDKVKKYYDESGALPVVQHTNKGGNTNIIKNPILAMYDDLNNTALVYWRELGLTPKGLKAIDEKAMKANRKQASLGEALRDLGI